MKIKVMVPLIILLLSFELSAQTTLEKEVADVFIQGIEKVVLTVIDSAFSPMVEYEQGELLFIGSPGFFDIRKLHEAPRVEGDGLYGYTLGAGAGYALTDRIMTYGILSFLKIDGTAEADLFGPWAAPTGIDTDYGFLSFQGGLGYELLSCGVFSLPIYAGVSASYYNLEAVSETESVPSYSATATTSTVIEGQGMLFGFSGGVAAQFQIAGFFFTPYYLFLANFTGASVESETVVTTTVPALTVPYTADHNLDPYMGGTFGLKLGYTSKRGWSFGLSLNNLISIPWGDEEDDSNDFTSVIISVSYFR